MPSNKVDLGLLDGFFFHETFSLFSKRLLQFESPCVISALWTLPSHSGLTITMCAIRALLE